MSRFAARHSSGDLAYGDEPEPQRWDRDRFERYRRGPPPEERETFRYTENDRPGRQEIRIEDRIERGPLPRRFAEPPVREREREQEREFFAEDRYGPPARPRRSDRDLFAPDPREVADRQLAPYRRKSIIDRDFEFREISRPRPGLVRRQSSLDTFDRRPLPRYEREEYRIPAGVPIPLPRRRSPSRGPRYYEEDDYEDIRYRDYSPHDYRDVEIMREKSVRRRRRSRAKSDVRSVASRKTGKSTRSSSTSSESSFEEVSRHSSPSPERKVGKKGKTRMPKRLVRKQAIIDLGYEFEEEEDFIIVRRALDKEHIDEVIRISEQYKEPKTTTYRYDEFDSAPPPPPPGPEDHYEHLRTEWINPPSIRAPSVRAPSPARTARTRRSSPARTVRQPSPPPAPQPQTIYIREPAPPPPPPQPIYVREPAPPAPPQQQPLTIVLPEHRHRDRSRDVNAEIRALEAERAALRLEREAEGHRELVLRRPEETSYEVVEYRDRRPDREVVEYVERARSPKRDIVRVEKDRKEKEKRQARKVAMMMATLT